MNIVRGSIGSRVAAVLVLHHVATRHDGVHSSTTSSLLPQQLLWQVVGIWPDLAQHLLPLRLLNPSRSIQGGVWMLLGPDVGQV